ncbi:aminoacyl-tRNA hydrolase [Chelatococcus asaccharovorans]|uniref:Peptidyl-tRNA hydrolase n=1 Tax=Chelatococcus asaccharovorans TaxID=28210 RepID=A0A2V3UBG7_9HYPH|nr:aminoacyl-tRNA hydrolase [Chelatococcus asaccharovorans]MBS7704430.1 aminoacyl-tRNA hydrolase [Chelatococcus asaccharovorans]PXW55690.1 PTH1 family peptidyl-tRNA hydrolase [Chelatococcus asaccharovorans]CAH1663750.1 Peptidyl-tRNA hydrolase [Chelatococcus asaccharovorans]CAH1682695.1 Peptidyl-tRNA hydrolase [Chelatococcus asaccharovorans]
MLLFVGLGNPGDRYRLNRHNVGFLAIEMIAYVHKAGPWRQRFASRVAEADIAGQRVLLMEPQTFMNESGRAVGEASRFLKIPLDKIVVFHDELDLAPAKLRMKTGGGNAGHNGLRSITAHIGNDYRRARLGIGHPGKDNVLHYVLSDFGRDEMPWVEDLTRIMADNAGHLAKGEDPSFQNKVHLAMDARGWGDVKRVGERGAAKE